MKPFRNRGWKWLRFMETIIPVAGATGSRSYAATEANPPSLFRDVDEELEIPLGNNSMDVDTTDLPAASTSTPASASVTKRQREDDDNTGVSGSAVHHPSSVLPFGSASGSTAAAPTPPGLSISSDRAKKTKKSISDKGNLKGKGKGKARTGSDHSSFITPGPSTSQRVEKITPAVAIVELHGSIKDMTKAIMEASKPPKVEDKAADRVQEAIRLMQERNDGLSLMEKTALVVFFGKHDKELDMYIALNDDELRQAVVRQWIGDV
jgi:hypothetical protein